MKKVKSIVLATAMAVGMAGLGGATPAFAAKKEKAPKAEKPIAPQLSAPFRAAVAPVEAALAAKNYPDAQAKLAAAEAIATAPDEKFFVGAKRLDIAQATNDRVLLRKAIVQMLDSNSPLNRNVGVLALNAGRLAYNDKDYADAVVRFNAAEAAGSLDPDGFITLADSYFRLKQMGPGFVAARKAVAASKAAGKVPDASWFARSRDAAARANMVPEMAEWSRMLVQSAPTKENWHDLVAYHLNGARPDEATRINLFRLMRDSGSMIEGREYRELAETLFAAKFPYEAKATLDDGVAKGLIKRENQQISDLYARIQPLLAGDKSSLAQADASSKASPTGRIPSRWADAFLGYGDNAKAVELYKLALAKGQVDANLINLHMGIALARAGMKAEATTAFAAVGGAQAEVAKYWKLWLDMKS